MEIVRKIKRKLWQKLVTYTRNRNIYPYLYRSYWHSLFHENNKKVNTSQIYFSAQPNIGAGIGHQMANWIAGYWFAKKFNLKFAHLPFSTNKWEYFLAFGEEEPKVKELLKQGYKKRRLPLFKEGDAKEEEIVKNIIISYSKQKVVLVCEQDQFYRNQFGVMEHIQSKFFNSPVRKENQLIFDKSHFNIAIHVRRGDILADPNNANLQMRYIANDYFKKVLDQVLEKLKKNIPIHVYFFSQGKPEDYIEFKGYQNFHWCLDMGAQESFLHMVYADVLITSKSSFSYKPALLNKGIKVVPENFWHGYPKSKDWILANNEGEINGLIEF
jgi:hypothetical protein